MKKFNKFKDSDAVSLDFKKIEAEVSENINHSIKRKYKKFRSFELNKFLRYAVCIMLTCVVSVGSTLLIQGSILSGGTKSDGGTVGNVNPFKSDLACDKYFDEFYIFSGGVLEMVNIDDILKTSIISETDKNTLKEYCNRKSKYFNIYMGVKDNKDIIAFSDISGKPYETLVFESNLSYSYKSVVEKFESLSGEKLTQEFLKASRSNEYFDEQVGEATFFNYETGGITMRFVTGVSDGFVRRYYIEYYTAIINDQIYIVTNRQLLNQPYI